MAAEFIGYDVLVTLRAPPNATVQGEVANVIGQRLMLRNGRYNPSPLSPMLSIVIPLLKGSHTNVFIQ